MHFIKFFKAVNRHLFLHMSSMQNQAFQMAQTFQRNKLKLMKCLQAISFIKTCIKKDIVPVFAATKIKVHNQVSCKVKHFSERLWLKEELKAKNRVLASLNKRTYIAHLCLSKSLDYDNLLQFLDVVNEYVENEKVDIVNRHEKKITTLMLKHNITQNVSDSPKFPFFEKVVNSSCINFSPEELHTLSKGLNFSVKPNIGVAKIKELLAYSKIALDNYKGLTVEKNNISCKLYELFKTELSGQNRKAVNNDFINIRSINRKLKENECIVVKADKGNTVVVMEKKDYIQKTLDFFSSNNIVRIEKDPTPKYQDAVKKFVKNCNFLLQNWEKRTCCMMNPIMPKLRSQPKIHKDGTPIRPIVSCIDSPGYILSQKLNQFLSKNYVFTGNFMLKNTLELIEAIQEIPIPENSILCSFDVTNLYTNVPVDEAIELVRINLIKYKKVPTPQIIEAIEGLQLILSHNYFGFNGQIYKQHTGLAMGCSLAGTLANIFLDNLETNIFKNNPEIAKKIVYYKRYVDDTLLLIKGDESDLLDIHQLFNNYHQNIKFTVEKEHNGTINFLDLVISRQHDRHNFMIFRKPTTTDIIIHETSNHPISYKHAYFHWMIDRLLKFPLSQEHRQKEIELLKFIATSNGYDSAIVEAIMNKKIKRKIRRERQETTLEKIDPLVKTRFIPIPYLGPVSDKIKSFFRKTNVQIVFQVQNSLKNMVPMTVSSPLPIYDQPGVYKINCGGCNKFYIGQTGRNLKTRFKEHLSKHNTSALGQHLRDSGHTIEGIDESMSILHKCKKGNVMDLLEEIEIFSNLKKYPQHILNEQKVLKNATFLSNFTSFLT